MYDKSPAKNLNKGYGSEMESPKQQRKNLMNDNPIAKDASGGRGGSWMSKHSQSKIGGSPLHVDGGKSAHTKSKSQKADFAWEGHKQLAHHKVKLGQITSKPSEKEIREMSDKNIN